MLYHYTDRLSIADICRDGEIRANPQTLHKDLLGQDEGLTTEPIVWLTINPILDGTVLWKMRAAGWDAIPGNLCRVVIPADYNDIGLGDYTDLMGIAPEWWMMVVQTGKMAGSDYTTWRIHRQPIPASDWVSVEIADTQSGQLIWIPHERT